MVEDKHGMIFSIFILKSQKETKKSYREEKMGGEQLLKRIPRIKFPKRHGNNSPSETSKSKDSSYQFSMAKSDVPAPPLNTAVGGKASLQPKRTPVTDREIEAVLLGGCL